MPAGCGAGRAANRAVEGEQHGEHLLHQRNVEQWHRLHEAKRGAEARSVSAEPQNARNSVQASSPPPRGRVQRGAREASGRARRGGTEEGVTAGRGEGAAAGGARTG